MGRAIVFDLGGTTLRTGLYCASGKSLIAEDRRDSPSALLHSDRTAEELVESLLETLRSAAEEAASGREFGGLGLAFPGPVAPGGVVHQAPTLWADRVQGPVELLTRLRSLWPGRRVVLVNDVTAAGHRYAPNEGVFCIVNVGSGIGHKVFVDGRALVGPRGRGGELGHWVADESANAPLCGCGRRGHLGALASGRAAPHHVERSAQRFPDAYGASPLRGVGASSLSSALASAFADGDAFAAEVVRAMAAPLGRALAATHLDVGVEDFVIVGGWAIALGEGYRRALASAAASACWSSRDDWDRMLRMGASDDNSGMLGMGRLLTENGKV